MKKRIAAKVVLLLLLSTGVRAEPSSDDPCITSLRNAFANENMQNSDSSNYEQMQKSLCQFFETSDWEKQAASGNLSIAGGVHKAKGAWSVEELKTLKEVFCEEGSSVKSIVENKSRYQKTFDKYYDTAQICANNYYDFKKAELSVCGIRGGSSLIL